MGTGVYRHVRQNNRLLGERLGLLLTVRRVAVRDQYKVRSVNIAPGVVTTRWEELIDDSEIDVVVELMGGIDIPYQFVMRALDAGKAVVTANKALLAEHGSEIFERSVEKQVPIFFEAAVAGGIPIIKSLREGFVGNHIQEIRAILNGTSNYILTRMKEEDIDFPDALAEAQREGYAEADPALDVNGWDAAHKAIILASLAYGFPVNTKQIHVEGIEDVTTLDIQFAERLDHTIKLIATIRANPEGLIELRVAPTLVHRRHVLASINGVFNALMVRGDIVGETLFYGRGAGQDPTASAVISDIAQAATWLDSSGKVFGLTRHALYATARPIEEVSSGFYLRLSVIDEPGVLAKVATVLGSLGIGISSVIQPEGHDGGAVPLVLMIHDTPFGRMREAVQRVRNLNCVKAPTVLLWVST